MPPRAPQRANPAALLSAKLSAVADLIQSGQYDKAQSQLLRLLQKHPRDPQVCTMLRLTALRLRQPDQAVYYAGIAADAVPENPDYAANLALAQVFARRFADGEATARRVLEKHPDHVGARAALGQALGLNMRFAEAAQIARDGLQSRPNDPALCGLLASSLIQSGRADEAVAFLRDAVKANVQDGQLWSLAASAHNYASNVTPDDILDVHVAYGQLLVRSVGTAGQTFNDRDRDPDRTLRVGLISPDLRRHATAAFLLGWLGKVDRSRVKITLYSTSPREDDVTSRLRELADAYRLLSQMPMSEAERTILADAPDVLIDLAGHTPGNALAMLARRLAPVQMNYLGYPCTTGLTTIDHRIVDSFSCPPEMESLQVERALRLEPCSFCYAPIDEPVPVEAPPSQREGSETKGSIVFGSFNAIQKLTNPTIGLWVHAINAVPGSRLMLKHFALAHEAVRDDVRGRFLQAGLSPERLILEGPAATSAELFPAYHKIDIALDPYPYHGTTTTCEALLMGVPVVSRVGDRFAARVGRSLLEAVGLGDLAVSSDEAFIETVSGLAGDAARLSGLRAELRNRFMASPIGDGGSFANRFESAVRTAWRSWCESR